MAATNINRSATLPVGFMRKKKLTVSFGDDTLHEQPCNDEDEDGLKQSEVQASLRHSASAPDEVPDMGDAHITSMSSVKSAVYGKAPGGVMRISDLVDNECVKILQKTNTKLTNHSMDFDVDLYGSGQVIDWHCQGNKDKLQWARKLTRQLFHAFKAEKKQQLVKHEDLTDLRKCSLFVLNSKYFIALSLLLTFYAVSGPDIFALAGMRAKYTLELACFNTVVCVFFVGESVIHLFAVRGYLCSPQFIVDTFAILSMVDDTWISYQFWKSDGAASGRVARALRALRMGGRSSRFIRLIKNVRLIQALRMMPRLWTVFESQRREVRVLLFYERLYRLFQALDVGEKQYLSKEEAEIFHMALALEFPTEAQRNSRGVSDNDSMYTSETSGSESTGSGWTFSRGSKLKRAVTSVHSGALEHLSQSMRRPSLVNWRHSWRMPWSSARVVPQPSSSDRKDFECLLHEVEHMPVGRLALEACERDLGRVESSFSLMHEAGGRLTLKVSIMVLAVLIVMPMLEIESQDWTDSQLLFQLDAMAYLAGPASSCSMVSEFAQKTKNKLILVALNMTLYWTPDCQCCSECCGTVVESLKTLTNIWEDWSGLQPHELQMHCYPSNECHADSLEVLEPRSLALLDIHEAVRYEALLSLVYTIVVVIIMLLFVFFFTTDLRVFNEKVLNPLWDLLDDMAAVKTVEFARGQDLTQLGVGVRNSISSILGKKTNMAHRLVKRVAKILQGFQDETTQLEEMAALEKAFGNFRNALRSWTKYVPLALVKKLVQSGIEVQLGVTKREVTVFFLDINGFDDLCKGLSPREVLIVFSSILQEVSLILDKYQGTLLEFIGDEMMAVFNAPNSVSEHPSQAVKAAAECLERLVKLRSMSLRARIGVHSAMVLAGNLGSPMRLKYGLLGDGVNMTARLKSLNSQLGTCCLVSSTTLQLAEADDIVKRPLGRYILKGRTTPTEVWEVLGRENTLPQSVKWAVEQHNKGFELFLQRDFKQARSLFAEVEWSLENQRHKESAQASRRLLQRCEEFIKNPPPEDWDGSEKLAKK